MDNIDLIFKALSDPIRLDILKKLYFAESVCVCELTDIFDISQSKLSYHLKLLLSANLISKHQKENGISTLLIKMLFQEY